MRHLNLFAHLDSQMLCVVVTSNAVFKLGSYAFIARIELEAVLILALISEKISPYSYISLINFVRDASIDKTQN